MFSKSILVLLMTCVFAHADITRGDAIAALKAVVGQHGVNRDVSAYLTAAPLPSGSSIAPFINEGAPKVLTESTWFGWIDDEPSAFFAHATRFVYIRASDGTVTVVNHEWWPELNGDSIFSEDAITADPGLVIIATKREVAP